MGGSGRIGAHRLVGLLGAWHAAGSRRTAAELAGAIRKLILDGAIAVGTGLPAERELAEVLGASRTLVTGAFQRLRAAGFVRSRRGAGSWATVPNAAPQLGLGEPAAEVTDLARAVPEAVHGMLGAVDAARVRLPACLGHTGYDAFGIEEARARIAQRYTDRGLPTNPEQVLVTGGAMTGLVRLFERIAGPGTGCFVEQPSYANALRALADARLRPLPVPMTPEGWDLPAMETVLRNGDAGLGYLLPDFHNPTGHRLAAQDRQRLGRMVRRSGIPVVVDETMCELDYAPGEAPPPMAAFAPRQVITLGSMSKSHWGGARLGWIRAERALLERVARPELGVSVFGQLLLAELLELDLTERRAMLAQRRDALVAALRERCPRWRFTVPDGGLSLWCGLPDPVSTRLVLAAEAAGIWLVPGGRFAAHGGLEHRIRIPFSLPAEQLTGCVRTIAACYERLGAGEVGVAPDRPVA